MAYYQFLDDSAQQPYGSCEIFYVDADDAGQFEDPEGQPLEPGWYWWACFPGCLPDGDPMGPFKSESEAEDDAGVA